MHTDSEGKNIVPEEDDRGAKLLEGTAEKSRPVIDTMHRAVEGVQQGVSGAVEMALFGDAKPANDYVPPQNIPLPPRTNPILLSEGANPDRRIENPQGDDEEEYRKAA